MPNFRGVSRLSVLLVFLLLAVQSIPVHAADVGLSIAWDQATMTIGRTPKLSISISNLGPNAIRVTSLSCPLDGTSIKATTPIRSVPRSIPANDGVEAKQMFKAKTPGVSTIFCHLEATDKVTGELISVDSYSLSVEVLAEQRLYLNTSASKLTTRIGKTVTFTAVFGNRGSTSFSNINVSCVELGRSMIFTDTVQTTTTLNPGQKGYMRATLEAVRTGPAPIACSITATDDSTGASITLPAPMVTIEVRE